MDVFLFTDSDGPTTGKSTLATLLALAKPVIAIDGPRRSRRLVEEGALIVVDDGSAALATALETLLRDPERRLAQGQKAGEVYHRLLSPEVAARLTTDLLSDLTRENASL